MQRGKYDSRWYENDTAEKRMGRYCMIRALLSGLPFLRGWIVRLLSVHSSGKSRGGPRKQHPAL